MLSDKIPDPTQIIHPTYEEWLGQVGEAGDGETECRTCANELTLDELESEDNEDPEGYKICDTCKANYIEFSFADFSTASDGDDNDDERW